MAGQVGVAAVGALGAVSSGLIWLVSKKKLDAELNLIENDLQDVEDEKFAALDEVDDLKKTVSTLEETLAATKAELVTANQARKEAEEANDTVYAQKLKASQAENDKLQSQIQVQQSEIARLMASIQKLNDELEDSKAQRDIAKDALKEVVQEKQRIEKEMAEAAEKDKLERQKLEKERQERERQEKEQKEKEQKVKEQKEKTAVKVPEGVTSPKLEAMQQIRNEMNAIKVRLQTEQLNPAEQNMLMANIAMMTQKLQIMNAPEMGAAGAAPNGMPPISAAMPPAAPHGIQSGLAPPPGAMMQMQNPNLGAGQMARPPHQQQQPPMMNGGMPMQQPMSGARSPQMSGLMPQQMNGGMPMQQPMGARSPQMSMTQQMPMQQQQQMPMQQQQQMPMQQQPQMGMQPDMNAMRASMNMQQQQMMMMQQQQQQMAMQGMQQAPNNGGYVNIGGPRMSTGAPPSPREGGASDTARAKRASMDRGRRASMDKGVKRASMDRGKRASMDKGKRGSMDKGELKVGRKMEKGTWADEFANEGKKKGGKCPVCKVEDLKGDATMCHLCSKGS
eukprot:CAMPEP_0118956808 /NCGR_PEP_ID=MMETSP1169-20130426/61772_1 /TAXON_ID=36882 /ORGANISM="Pyramimonas obovata, Strain CCMP722" /LENGTH=561 /DNA_ID=CAMNT_0006904855 /DNA_START=205 /DNA_END=1890 /DNA_ORIENTATION=-